MSVDILFELLICFVLEVAGLGVQQFEVFEEAGVNGLFQNGAVGVGVIMQDVLW